MYKPNTKNSRKDIPYRALINQIDPDLERAKHFEPEYLFSRRAFFGDPLRRGAANRLSNTYPVGNPQGTPDPAIAAALAPTVGNAVPGLYERVAS